MSVMVTGAGGLLGSHLVATLAKQTDRHIVAVTSQPSADATNLWRRRGAPQGSQIEIVHTDDIVSYLERTRTVEWIVNCAFPRNLGSQRLARGLDFHQELFAAARFAEVGGLLNMSSQSVYAASRSIPADETGSLELDTPYATAKYATEIMASSILAGRQLMNARLSSLIAPDFDQRVVNKLTRRALAGEDLIITKGTQIFDFMDVRDAARAVATVLDQGVKRGTSVLNIGAGRPRSLFEIATLVQALAHAEAGVEVQVLVKDEESSATSSALDCSLLRSAYSFQPSFELKDTVADMIRTWSVSVRGNIS